MTVTDSWALMALFFPHCDWDFAGLGRVFVGLFRASSKLYSGLPSGGEMRETGLGFAFVFTQLGFGQVTLTGCINQWKSKTYFLPCSP